MGLALIGSRSGTSELRPMGGDMRALSEMVARWLRIVYWGRASDWE